MSTTKPRPKTARARLNLRLAAREVAEIQAASKKFGATTPAAFFLALVRQRTDAETLAVQIERQLQAVVEVAVGAAVATLGDRLAGDLANLSASLSALTAEVAGCSTKTQIDALIARVRGVSGSAGNAPASGATLAPKGGAQ